MGMSKIEITVTGNHGCGREAKEGEVIPRCGSSSCIDCQAAAFVAQLRDRGGYFGSGYVVNEATGERFEEGARLRHWPGTEGEVVDDLIAGTRTKGSF